MLEVKNLCVDLSTATGCVRAVDGVGFRVAAGECYALVGESGCGKSLTALSVMRLLPEGLQISQGSIMLEGTDLLQLTEGQMQGVRGARAAMIFQEPATSLNPVMTVGSQIEEAVLLHGKMSAERARAVTLDWLKRAGLDEPERAAAAFPHELSGGQKQRVMIAMALACSPSLVVADEPTTALDVTRQAQILDLLKSLQKEKGIAFLLITHDLALVRRYADRVGLMYAGQIVEEAPTQAFFQYPRHPYARLLLKAVPSREKSAGQLSGIEGTVPELSAMPQGCRFAGRCPLATDKCRVTPPAMRTIAEQESVRCHLWEKEIAAAHQKPAPAAAAGQNILTLEDVSVVYGARSSLFSKSRPFEAVKNVSLELSAGRTLALVGESGSGKTTLGKALLGLLDNARVTGRIRIAGVDAFDGKGRFKRSLRSTAQIVFQDPFASLDPRMSVGEIIVEGIRALRPEAARGDLKREIASLLDQVGLPSNAHERLAHEFSGGQRQRIAIARTLAVEPKLIVCDEPTSALDVSVQAQILNLLRQIQADTGVSYLFITHNFAVVEFLAHEVAVMQSGVVVEKGSARDVLEHPQHPYTAELLQAVPRL